MADNPSIREMLADAVEKETPTSSVGDSTPKTTGGSEGNAPPTATPAGETFSKYETKLMEGHDTTGWTDSQKREWVNYKKAYDKGWHGSNTAYARAKDLVDRLVQAGVTDAHIQKAIHLAQNEGESLQALPRSPETVAALKGIDRLIAEATDPDVKEQLRKSKQVLVEETEGLIESRVQTRLKPIEEELGRLKAIFGSARSSEVSAEIDALEDEGTFPASLIEKYRVELIRWGLEYPQVEMEDILFKVVPAKELRAAMASPPESPPPKEEKLIPIPRPAPRTSAKPATVSGNLASDEGKFRKPRGGWDMPGVIREAVLKATGVGA